MRRKERDFNSTGSAYKGRKISLIIETYCATLIEVMRKMAERSWNRYYEGSNVLAGVPEADINCGNSTTMSQMKIPIPPYFQIFKERSITISSIGALKEGY